MPKMYPKGKDAIMGSTDLLSNNLKVSLVSSGYTYNDLHQFFTDLTNVLGTSANLGSKTLDNGVFDAANTSIVANALATCQAFVLWHDTGTPSTSPLLMFYDATQIVTISADTSSSVNIPVDPLPYDVADGSLMTRISGTGPTSVTLTTGNTEGERLLIANANQSMVKNAKYSIPVPGLGLPLNVNNGQTVDIPWDNIGKILQWIG